MEDAHVSFDLSYSYEALMMYVNKAIENGIDKIVVLEPSVKFKECALLYKEVCAAYPYQKSWYDGIDKISICEYQKFILEMRKLTFPIQVRFGLCVCYFTQHEQFIKELCQAFPYDCCSGYIQFLDNIALAWPSHSNEMMWDKYNTNFLYRRYYEMMNAMLSSGIFDGVSGFDNIKVMGFKPTFRMNHTYHKMAMQLAVHHMYVEDDTSVKYRLHHDDAGLSEEFRSLCRELGVTIRRVSNAQSADEIGKLFEQV